MFCEEATFSAKAQTFYFADLASFGSQAQLEDRLISSHRSPLGGIRSEAKRSSLLSLLRSLIHFYSPPHPQLAQSTPSRAKAKPARRGPLQWATSMAARVAGWYGGIA